MSDLILVTLYFWMCLWGCFWMKLAFDMMTTIALALDSHYHHITTSFFVVQFSSVTQSCSAFYNPVDCTMPCFPVHHQLPELAQTYVHWVGDATNHLILCRPLILLASVLPGIRVFSNESILHNRWPKYWSFSFGFNPSNKCSGLIFRIDWFDLLASKGLSRVFSNTTVQKHQFFSAQPSLGSNSHNHTWLLEKL